MTKHKEQSKDSFVNEVLNRVAHLDRQKQTIVKPIKSNSYIFRGIMVLGIVLIILLLISFISANYHKNHFIPSLTLLMLIASAYISIIFFKWIK